MVDTIEQEERILEKDREEEKSKKEKMWKTIGVIFLVFGIILLVVWASSSKNFKIFPFLGAVGGILILFVGMFWGVGIYRRMQELQEKNKGLGKLPPPVTLEQGAEIMEEMLKHPRYADYILGWEDHKIYNAGRDGKSLILAVRLKTAYNANPFQYFIMNMHYPRDRWSYINQTKYNPSEITRCVNALAFNPEKDPDTEIIEEENPMTGTRRRVVSTHRQEEKEKEEQKKGDFR